jgi:hypothetical protein
VLLAEWAIVLAIVFSGVFIARVLGQIADRLLEISAHLWEIRLACSDMNLRGQSRADAEARAWLADRAAQDERTQPHS